MIINCNQEELFLKAFDFLIHPIDNLLDIGCGIRPYTQVNAFKHICCEPYEQYVNILKFKFPSLDILKLEWGEVVDFFKPKSVDTVLLLDVIEHLEKNEGMNLLLKTLPLVKKQVVIFTPLGFLEQSHPNGIDAWGLKGGEWQTHRSGWFPKDFPNINGGYWTFFVCDDFHTLNHKGEILTSPKGAFFAIWTTVK